MNTDTKNKYFNTIKSCDFFRGLEDDLVYKLLSNAIIKKFSKGELIIEEGTQTHKLGIFVIYSGAVDIVITSSEGKKVMVNVLEKNNPVNTLSYLDKQETTASVFAKTDTELLLLKHITISEVFSLASHKYWLSVCKHLCQIIRRSQKFYKIFNFEQDITKVCNAIILYKNNSILIATEKRISELSGVSQRHVNTILKRIEKKGYLKRMRGKIEVIDIEALRSIAEGNTDGKH